MKQKSLFLMCLFTFLPLVANADAVEIDGIYYNLNASNHTAEVTSNPSKYSGDVVIPSTVSHETVDYSVTSIGNEAFKDCSGLTSVSIPNCVTSIGNYAFSDCVLLSSVTIPPRVTSIGEFSFDNCAMTSITIPASLTNIGANAFYWCDKLESIIVDSSNPKYDSRDNCNAIIETASKTLIRGCKTTIIPNSVITIDDSAFRGCRNSLESITIPDGVTTIGNLAFADCHNLVSMIIPNSMTTIGAGAFLGCRGLTDVYCYAVNVPTTDATAFNNCNFSNVTLHVPESSISAYSNATPWNIFNSNGNSIAAAPAQEYTNEELGVIFSINANGTYTVSGYTNACTGPITIPTTVNGCSVTSISNEAFSSCYSLTSVVIPVGVTSIGQGAFENCPNLSSAPIPAGLTSIGMWAFLNTGLTSLSIPASVTSIGADAFGWCPALASIQVEAGNTIYDSRDNCNAIIEKSSNTLIAGCKNSVIPSTVTSIGDWAFYYSGLGSVTIPSSVTSIGPWAFGGTALTSLTIPASVTSIGNDAFSYCNGLLSINVADGNTMYDSRDNCNAIIEKSSNKMIRGCKNTSFPASVTTIGYRAFMNSGITSIVIPNTITSIETMAFESCDKLESIQVASDNEKYDSRNNSNAIIETSSNTLIAGCKNTVIPDDVTIIGERAFSGDALTVLCIPSSVTSIGNRAFWGNVELTDVFCYATSVPNTADDAFEDCNISNVTLHVPESSISVYTTTPWSGFKSIVAAPAQEFTDDQGVKYTLNADGQTYTVSGHIDSSTQDITIPATLNGCSVTAIGYQAFIHCSGLTSITIPASVTSIGERAFDGCFDLSAVKIGSSTPIDILSDTFEDNANAILYVPKGSKASYFSATGWQDFSAIKEYPDGDVNQDGEIDVIDVVDIARFVVGTPSTAFDEFLADLDGSGAVNVADAIVLVNEIAGDTNFARSRAASFPNLSDNVLSLTGDGSALSLQMDGDGRFAAFQFDLWLPSDMDVMKFKLNDMRRQGHQLLYNKVSDSHYRVVALSTSGNAFNGISGELLGISLDNFANDEVYLDNIHFVTTDGLDVPFDSVRWGYTTSILRPEVTNRDGQSVYNLNGQRLNSPRKGVNIIGGKKVVIK